MKKAVVELFNSNLPMTRNKNSCWEWQGGINGDGYGNSYNGEGVEAAHRISYRIHNGKIPYGMVIMHKCDNPSCVNPNHLKLGTQSENMQDCSIKGRRNPISLLNLKQYQHLKR